MNEFGDKIKTLRTERGLSVKDACHQAGIPQSRLSELERGVRLPTASQISILEQFYDLDPGSLAALSTADS